MWAQINELTEERVILYTLRVSCVVTKRSESQLYGDEKE